MNYWMQSPTNIYVAAHRGWRTKYPENTMAAFRASVDEGYDYIEFDPKYTSDGEIVILHDHTLDRTARNADGSNVKEGTKIKEITLSEARGYDYGLWFSEDFRGEKIPLLRELLDLAAETNGAQIPWEHTSLIGDFSSDTLASIKAVQHKKQNQPSWLVFFFGTMCSASGTRCALRA